jgi:hypothetical protein
MNAGANVAGAHSIRPMPALYDDRRSALAADKLHAPLAPFNNCREADLGANVG